MSKPPIKLQNIKKTDTDIALTQALNPLLVLTGMFFFNFYSRILFAPMLPDIETELQVSHSQISTIFLFLTAGVFTSVLGSGFISSRLNHRGTIVASSLSVGLSMVLLSRCTNLIHIQIMVLLLGLSAGPYIPSSIALITSLVRTKEWGRALAIHELAPNVAFVAAPLVYGIISSQFAWRELLFINGICTLCMSGVFLRWGQGGRFYGQEPNFKLMWSLLRTARFWKVTALFTLGITATMGIYSMLPLFLVSYHGVVLSTANTIIGCSRGLSIASALLAGWIVDRLGYVKTMAWIFSVGGLLTIGLGTCGLPLLWGVIFLQPLVTVCFFPAGFIAISTLGDEKQRNITISLVVPLATALGGGVIPLGIGILGEAGLFNIGMTIPGILLGIGAILSLNLDR